MKKENPLRHLPSGQESYGKILIHLDDILKERNISLNQLSFRARNAEDTIKKLSRQ